MLFGCGFGGRARYMGSGMGTGKARQIRSSTYPMSVLRRFSAVVPRAARYSWTKRSGNTFRSPLIRSKALQQPLAATAGPSFTSLRFYSGGPAPLTPEFVFERISGVLSNCDRVDAAKITPEARLEEDLGLDSLDVVDALLFVEEEFTVQMSDEEADSMATVKDVVDWVVAQPDAF